MSETPEKPVLTLLQQLKDGSVHPDTLTKDQRQQCVETLFLEGYSIPQIAQVVERSGRTVKRDMADIRSRNALNPSPELAKQLIGDLFIRTEAHHARLVRIAGSAEGSAAEKAQATFLAFRVLKERTELLQSLGYLPQRPQQVIGDVMHHMEESGDLDSPETIEKMIAEIEEVGQDSGGLLPAVREGLKVLRQRLEEVRLAQQAQHLLAQQRQVHEAGDGD